MTLGTFAEKTNPSGVSRSHFRMSVSLGMRYQVASISTVSKRFA